MSLTGLINIGANPYDDPNYRPTYGGRMMGGGENPYTSLINDYVQSDYFDRTPFLDPPRALAQYSFDDPIFGQITGGYNPYNTQGFSDFLENSYSDMQNQMTNRLVKSPEFMDKFDLYGDAYNIKFPGENPGMPDFITGGTAPDGTAQLPGGGTPSDPVGAAIDFNNASSFPQIAGGTGINTAAIPYLNLGRPNPNFIPGTSPFDPVTSPITPPPTMNSSHSHDDLLKGIGDLFKQYFPNQGQSSQSNFGQPNFSNNFGYAQPNGPGILGLILPQRS